MTSHSARRLRSLVSVFSTEPKVVGVQLLLSSIAWIAVAAFLTLVVRWQQTWPWTEPPLVGQLFFAKWGGQLTPEFFSWLELTRDSTIVYFAVLPLMVGVIGNWIMPQRIGAERFALGRWNRTAFWLLWAAFLLLGVSCLRAGWHTPGDLWAQSSFLGAVSLAALAWIVIAVSQLATVSRFRCQGITIERLPLSVWGLVIADGFLCIALPLLLLAHAVQLLDALAGTSVLALTGYVPAPVVQNGLQPGLGILSASIFRQLPVSFLLLLPGIGFIYDRLFNQEQHQRIADRTMLYAMLGVGGLALVSWFHALPFLGGDPPSATGPMLLPARLIILPLAVLIGGFVLAFRTHTNRPDVSTSYAVAFVLTLLTGTFCCVVLTVEPLSSYLQATYAADALWLCLVLFGAILVTWVVVYDGLKGVPGQRFVNSVGWLHCVTVCIGLPAIWWTWFALGIVGLPGRVADARQFEAFAAPSPLQAWLTGLLAVVLGVQLVSAVVLLVWWLVGSVLGERSVG